jgi:hypothetical protein
MLFLYLGKRGDGPADGDIPAVRDPLPSCLAGRHSSLPLSDSQTQETVQVSSLSVSQILPVMFGLELRVPDPDDTLTTVSIAMLRIRIRKSGAFLSPGSGIRNRCFPYL